jgi:hypothetical protein
MFSNELAHKLIKLPKKIQGGEVTVDLSAVKSRIVLSNDDEHEYEFLFEITSHKKITFKITFHNQENNTKEGLIRIDYKGGHKNPETLTDFVPEIVKPYVGYFFQNEPHVHIYVEGFKDLPWAIPLSVYNFPILEIENSNHFIDAIQAFAKEINIVSSFNIQNAIL